MAPSIKSQVSSLLQRMGGVYQDPARVSQDSIQLLQSSVGKLLKPETSSVIQNDGTELPKVLNLIGMIPITYRNVTYNIPIEIYVTPGYPIRPPLVYVRPTASMMIQESHPHVAMDGSVHIPYLRQWTPNTSTLVQCCTLLSSLFGTNPPVFARPVVASSSSSSSNLAHSTTASVVTSTSVRQHAALSEEEQEEERRIAREVEEANRVAEIARLAEQDEIKEQERTRELRQRVSSRLQFIFSLYLDQMQSLLTQDQDRNSQLQHISTHVQEHQIPYWEQRTLELLQCQEEMEMAIQVMEKYLAQVEESKKTQNPEKDMDQCARPRDVASEQLLVLTAKDHSLSETFYYLDQALFKGEITLEVHLKKVRDLAREQFLIRAHLNKVEHAINKKHRR